MLDSDLAELYGVETRVLNQAVKRNGDRFPTEFCFMLNNQEMRNIRSQFVILNRSEDERGKHRKFLPYVFTEQAVDMLSRLGK